MLKSYGLTVGERCSEGMSGYGPPLRQGPRGRAHLQNDRPPVHHDLCDEQVGGHGGAGAAGRRAPHKVLAQPRLAHPARGAGRAAKASPCVSLKEAGTQPARGRRVSALQPPQGLLNKQARC